MSDYIYVLRTIEPDFVSYGGFRNPERGWVEAPDWDGGERVCGGGLHGLPWGVGCANLLLADDAIWQAVRVNPADGYVEFGNKCKFRRGYIVKSVPASRKREVLDYLVEKGAPPDKAVFGRHRT